MECKKTKFASKEAAQHAITKFKKSIHHNDRPTYSYHCKFCKCWHLSSRKPIEDMLIEMHQLQLALREALETIQTLTTQLNECKSERN